MILLLYVNTAKLYKYFESLAVIPSFSNFRGDSLVFTNQKEFNNQDVLSSTKFFRESILLFFFSFIYIIMSKQSRLKYKIVSYTSEQKQYPVSNLLIKNSLGWQSARFCSYPQQITLQFYSEVHIQQLQFVSNCRKIASRIDILFYSDKEPNSNNRFQKYGFVQLASNEQTNYERKQVKSILVDIKCMFLRILLHKNHANKQNFFSQVGIHEINVFGTGKQTFVQQSGSANRNIIQLQEKETSEDEYIHQKLAYLNQMKGECVKLQKYQDAKVWKDVIQKVKSVSRQVFNLENKKRRAVEDQNYQQAQSLKNQIEKIKLSIQDIISNPNNFRSKKPNIENNQNEQYDLSHSNAVSKVVKTNQNEFAVDQNQQYFMESSQRRQQSAQRQLPTTLANRKSKKNQFEQKQIDLPKQPQPIEPKYQKEAQQFFSLFEQKTVRKFFSKYWQFQLEAMTQFSAQLKKPTKTKGKDQYYLLKCYLYAIARNINSKFMQITQQSLTLLYDFLTAYQKTHTEPKHSELLQADIDKLLNQVSKRLFDNNVKTKGLAQEVFKRMAQSGIFGIVACCQCLLKSNQKTIKSNPKQIKSKLDTLIFFIHLYGMGMNAVPFLAIDFALSHLDNKAPEIRSGSIDLLVEASLSAGGQQKIRPVMEKMNNNTKEMLNKKIENARSQRQLQKSKSIPKPVKLDKQTLPQKNKNPVKKQKPVDKIKK